MLQIEMNRRDLHLFYTLLAEVDDPRLHRRYRELIGEEEQQAIDRYRFAADRQSRLVTRALARYACGLCMGMAAADLAFVRNDRGKPALSPECTALPIRFNLSHCPAITVCAVALDQEIGVDIEPCDREIDLDIGHRYFTAAESSSLRNAPPMQKRSLFYRFWTLKEAYCKARGLGLSLGLDTFGFSLDGWPRIFFPEQAVSGDRVATTSQTPEQWRFFSFRLEKAYQVAVAVEAGPRARPSQLHLYRCLPLHGFARTGTITYRGG